MAKTEFYCLKKRLCNAMPQSKNLWQTRQTERQYFLIFQILRSILFWPGQRSGEDWDSDVAGYGGGGIPEPRSTGLAWVGATEKKDR